MWQPELWWRGLVPLAVIAAVAAFAGTGAVERDLAQRTGTALAQGRGLVDAKPWTMPVVAGRDVLLGGQAPDTPAIAAVTRDAAGVWGVRKVSATAALVPEASPYRLTASVREARIVLGGSVPPDGARTRLLGAASEGGQVPVEDRLRYARGAPTGFEGAAAIGLRQLRRLVSGELVLEDASLSIVGEASNAQVAQEVSRAVRSLPAGFMARKVEIYAPAPTPYAFAATFADGNLSLGGFLPDPATRDTVLTRVRSSFPGARLTDGLALARGAPAGLDTARAAGFVVETLAALSPGKVSLSGDLLAVSGDARDMGSYERVRQSLAGALPGGLRLGQADVRLPAIRPYRFEARRSDGVVTLEGFVPDDSGAEAIRERVRGQFLDDRIADGLAQGRGAPAGFREVALAAIDQLARLANGRVVLEDQTLDMQGSALHERAAQAVKDSLSSMLPAGWTLARGEILVSPPGPPLAPDACQSELVSLMGRGALSFETGSATIYRASFGLLDNLVHLLQRCPRTAVDISGHTDTDGAPERNLDLSNRRAGAVAEYLRTAGIAADRLNARGYGATRPLVPNDTEANKARNRRIEFQVRP